MAVEARRSTSAPPSPGARRCLKELLTEKSEILQVDSKGLFLTDRRSLFKMAWAVNDKFQKHALKAWAQPSGGTHHAAKVKTVHRTYQKVRRAYGGRMHRVLDLVRTTITFRNMHQLIACLDLIEADSEVSILRVKNRYDPDFHSADGYRDVSMIIVGRSLTRNLCCEVQLNLEDMYKAKTGGGHKRYKAMRDARGD